MLRATQSPCISFPAMHSYAEYAYEQTLTRRRPPRPYHALRIQKMFSNNVPPSENQLLYSPPRLFSTHAIKTMTCKPRCRSFYMISLITGLLLLRGTGNYGCGVAYNCHHVHGGEATHVRCHAVVYYPQSRPSAMHVIRAEFDRMIFIASEASVQWPGSKYPPNVIFRNANLWNDG